MDWWFPAADESSLGGTWPAPRPSSPKWQPRRRLRAQNITRDCQGLAHCSVRLWPTHSRPASTSASSSAATCKAWKANGTQNLSFADPLRIFWSRYSRLFCQAAATDFAAQNNYIGLSMNSRLTNFWSECSSAVYLALSQPTRALFSFHIMCETKHCPAYTVGSFTWTCFGVSSISSLFFLWGHSLSNVHLSSCWLQLGFQLSCTLQCRSNDLKGNICCLPSPVSHH